MESSLSMSIDMYVYIIQFSLFVVVVVNQVHIYTELANTESLPIEEIQGQVPVSLWSQYFH